MSPDEVKNRFIVVKDFYKLGSIVLSYDKKHHRQFVGDSNTLRAIALSPIQVVVMGGEKALEMYSEYAPYTFVDIDDVQDVIDMVLDNNVPGKINPFIKDSPYLTEEQRSKLK